MIGGYPTSPIPLPGLSIAGNKEVHLNRQYVPNTRFNMYISPTTPSHESNHVRVYNGLLDIGYLARSCIHVHVWASVGRIGAVQDGCHLGIDVATKYL